MPNEYLAKLKIPKLNDATMLLALTGWMDGGFVSTGTVRSLMADREIADIARIHSDPFYIYNFPGSMEIAALFRPTVRYADGVITELELPTNTFHADESANLVFFIGKEPNLLWQAFADCIFDVAQESGVKRIIFMGSFGGGIPHTREPRLYGSVSHLRLKPLLADHGIRPSDYEGPGSFSTYLLSQSEEKGVEMLSLAAEIPGYLEGINPISIEAISRRLAKILNLPLNLDRLRRASNEWEARVTEAVEKDPKLATTIRRLEHRYDNELIGETDEDEEEESEEGEEQDEEREEE
jgi:proteasome assembly chaperone (PAC2) family protein